MKWVLFALLFLAACSIGTDNNIRADIVLEPSEITISNNTISDPVVIGITKKDSGDPVRFRIELESPNPDMLQFFSGEQEITSIQTAEFKREGDRLSEEFSVRADKPEGSESTTWKVNIFVVHNGTDIGSDELTIIVE